MQTTDASELKTLKRRTTLLTIVLLAAVIAMVLQGRQLLGIEERLAEVERQSTGHRIGLETAKRKVTEAVTEMEGKLGELDKRTSGPESKGQQQKPPASNER
jgi:hypothetical protein